MLRKYRERHGIISWPRSTYFFACVDIWDINGINQTLIHDLRTDTNVKKGNANITFQLAYRPFYDYLLGRMRKVLIK